jgi:hypothetical protein
MHVKSYICQARHTYVKHGTCSGVEGPMSMQSTLYLRSTLQGNASRTYVKHGTCSGVEGPMSLAGMQPVKYGRKGTVHQG